MYMYYSAFYMYTQDFIQKFCLWRKVIQQGVWGAQPPRYFSFITHFNQIPRQHMKILGGNPMLPPLYETLIPTLLIKVYSNQSATCVHVCVNGAILHVPTTELQTFEVQDAGHCN